jgi:signal transduction histidine kinase
VVPVFLNIEGELERLPEPHRTCVYRVVQEALTNCAKHARAGRVEVAVRDGGGRVFVSVRDDGVGIAAAAARGRGLGLVGIEERVREVGGALAVRPNAAGGTTLEIDIPVPFGSAAHESLAG